MRQLLLPLGDGFDFGPLFAPPRKVRAPKPRMRSTHRDRVLRARIPAWADRGAIRRTILIARERTRRTGICYHVDHIVPINHPFVSGLHCEANLQIVLEHENVMKSNWWWPNMWGEQPALFDSPTT